ncbi:RES domain protein [Streptomyces sp. CBMAI 2042]|uniref:RES family NAD+ phosphorylase n=1 Tax=Streptomyces sp. CBMAI 2042 TaxID=2305222 RepID=UPI000F2DAFDE|nr:RES family NAD+ phosphorylase [Streptomyces sp. CBMAI 2042]RLV69262.1 RES domain protein [Streptomyces sp. CBMAI 2042]
MCKRIDPFPYDLKPHQEILPIGTKLWRMHSSKRPAHAFRPFTPEGGGRFDGSVEDPYACLYVAKDRSTALAETLLRTLDYDPRTSSRLIQRAAITGKSLSAMRTRCELLVVPLISAEQLADVCQDARLLEGEGAAYYCEQTRPWSSNIRLQAPDITGLLWQSKRNQPRHALVLFEDRCRAYDHQPLELVEDAESIPDLGSEAGIEMVNRLLQPLRAAVAPAETSPPWADSV